MNAILGAMVVHFYVTFYANSNLSLFGVTLFPINSSVISSNVYVLIVISNCIYLFFCNLLPSKMLYNIV